MSTISSVILPNLNDLGSRAPAMEEGVSLASAANIQRDLRVEQPSRTLPDGAVEHHAAVRYTSGQMEMRPVDRADAALMAVTEPDTFRQFIQALSTDGDWRSILEPFAQRLQQHPEWLEDRYRLPAAEVLRRSQYFMDLTALVQLGLIARG